MLVKTPAIVFKTTKYSETSLIVKLYTRSLGLKNYIIKGVRGEKSKNKSVAFRAGNIIEIDAYLKNHKELNFIKEYRVEKIWHSIPGNMLKTSLLVFMLEVLNKSISEEECNEPLFDFIEETFELLNHSQFADPNMHLTFMIQLSSYLGFQPDNNFTLENPYFNLTEGVFHTGNVTTVNDVGAPYSRWIYELTTQQNTQGITNQTRSELLEHLISFYKQHLPSFKNIQSNKIFHEVLQ